MDDQSNEAITMNIEDPYFVQNMLIAIWQQLQNTDEKINDLTTRVHALEQSIEESKNQNIILLHDIHQKLKLLVPNTVQVIYYLTLYYNTF